MDERGFDLRGDLADFAGIAGPLVGSLQFLRPQSKILNFFKNQPRFGRISAVAAGSAAGKGVEEAVETLRGVQEQDLGQVARTLGQEALLGAAGQTVGEAFGGLYTMYFGKRIPIDDGRDWLQESLEEVLDSLVYITNYLLSVKETRDKDE